MISWKIFYGDGTTFDSSQGEPSEAPTTNCQCIMLNEQFNYMYLNGKDAGSFMLHGWDYCLHKKSTGWVGVEGEVNLGDHLLSDFKDINAIVKARTIPIIEFQRIMQKAVSDPAFPKKTTIRKDETPRNRKHHEVNI